MPVKLRQKEKKNKNINNKKTPQGSMCPSKMNPTSSSSTLPPDVSSSSDNRTTHKISSLYIMKLGVGI